MNRLNRLREGLARTRAQLIARLGEIAGAPPAEFFEQLEITLIEADVGAPTTQRILQQLRARRDATDQAARLSALREILLDVLGDPVPLRLDPPPAGLVMLGVNGAGKTTSIGKLAHRLKTEGRTVLLAAADTFRAAAIDQLAVWAQRAGCDLVAHAPGADPAAVVYDACQAARARRIDVLIVDTAGRLHTKTNLVEELKKINRVLTRELSGSPVERGVVASRFLLPVSVLSCLLTPRLVAQYTGLVCKVKSLYMLPGRHGSDALRTDVDGPADRGIRPAIDRAPAARPATVLP